LRDDLVAIEKKKTNKIGIILLILIVLGALGYGAYYYITNKNLIIFEYNLPWEDKEEKKDDNNKNQQDSQNKKSNKETPIEREEVEFALNNYFYDNNGITMEVIGSELKDNAYTIKIRVANNNTTTPGTFSSKVKAITVDNYLLTRKFDYQVNNGESITYELVLPAEELDKYRLRSFSKIELISDNTFNGETNSNNIVINSQNRKNESKLKTIANIDTINKELVISYYKKVDTNNSSKLYFLFENKGENNYTYYINRLMVDDKEVEATQYSGIVYGKSSYISSIEIEKSFLSQNKKIRISFLVQTDDKSVYKSNEKEFDL